ncbi:hypothetical protein V8F20_005316 [Naviculisporaceae sp. PSN 640]
MVVIRIVILAALSLIRPCVASSGNCRGDASIVCSQLDQNFTSALFLPDETEYPKLRSENWSQTAWRKPSCIFRPANAQQVQQVVAMLVKSNVCFAVRSGGHSPDPTAANIDNGVLVDLSGLNRVENRPSDQVAVIGSGLRWGEVYSQLQPHNVTVVGGRVLDVGVGGLTLGGGLSYLSDLYGLVCDNVVNFELVLANGSLTNANQTHNADLFWALKGGGNNFGIVTALTLVTYPDMQVWGGVKTYDMKDLPALYAAMLRYQSVRDKDPYANLMLQGFITSTSAVVVLNLIYLGPKESPPAFAPFYGINATSDSTKISSFTEFLATQGPVNFPRRVDWRTTSFTPNAAVYRKIHDLLTATGNSNLLRQITSVPDGTVAFGVQPISANVMAQGALRGGNALGLSAVNQTWHVLDVGWQLEKDDARVHAATRKMTDEIEVASRAEDAYLPYLFMNDASWDQDVIGHYGARNVARMKLVRAKYDPKNTLQRLMPGGFKLH